MSYNIFKKSLFKGAVIFLAVCYSFSTQSSIIPPVIAASLYFIFGVIDPIKERRKVLLFFSPFLITALVFFNNRDLFPEVFPGIIIVSVASFFCGKYVRRLVAEQKSYLSAVAVMGANALFVFLFCTLFVPFAQHHRNVSTDAGEMTLSEEEMSSFLLKDKENDTITLFAGDKKLLVLDFWFSGCSLCYDKNTFLNDVAYQYKDNDRIEFYVITMGNLDSFDKFKNVIRKHSLKNINYLYDSEGKFSKKMGVAGVPCEFIIKNGKVIRKLLGFTNELAAYEKNKMNSFINDELRKL